VSWAVSGPQRDAIERAAQMLGNTAQRDRSIGELTTYRVGGAAALFSEARDLSDLLRLADVVASSGVGVLVLGKGSNVLVCDTGFAGLCIRLADGFSWVRIEAELVRSGGATPYPVLARRSVAAGLSGLEWAVGIPGSVGGAVRMNAGGHGSQTSDRLVDCVVLDLATSVTRTLQSTDLGLSYRHSCLGPLEVVVEASYQLEPGNREVSNERIAEIVRWRRANQPGGQNAGSVFTNPVGDSAGRLIEAAGLKGLRIGSAAVSEKHANFIQADPGGSADDVHRVIQAVRSRVAGRFGVELQTELHLVGFDGDP